MTKHLHTMIRVSSLEDSIAFFEVLGLYEIRRRKDDKGRYTNVFLAAPGDEAAPLELTYNWDPQSYAGGRNFGHLAYAVDNIYDTCSAFIARSVTINRPPRDGRMAFIRTPTASPSSCCRPAARCRQPNPGPVCPTPVPGSGHYVWVFANLVSVAYVYSSSREASILDEILAGFDGVLVSDFYGGV